MESAQDPLANAPLLYGGADLATAQAAVVLIHGRGATAADILQIADWIGLSGVAYIAPQAVDRTWYPLSFLMPLADNEPWLSSALRCVERTVQGTGMSLDRVAILGFSQGACLTLEYAVRNPRRYGALMALSGGVIGPPGTVWNSEGSLEGTPTFIGCSDVDPHIPVERVRDSGRVLGALGAKVEEHIYKGMGHTINDEEVDACRKLIQAMV